MTPEQSAAFINAQAAVFLIELEAMKANDRCTTQPYTEEAYLELLKRAEAVLGHNAVLTIFEGAR